MTYFVIEISHFSGLDVH